jgi:hypothetical protein
MSALSPPPPPSRHRASSTTLSSAFSNHSLGRRRSSSFIHPEPSTPPPSQPPALTIDPVSPSTTNPSPSMLVIFASRFLEWLHLQPKHTFSWSTPSSPRSSDDVYVLPLSASAHKTSFSQDIQDSISKSQFPYTWRQGFLSVCHAFFFFPIAFSYPFNRCMLKYYSSPCFSPFQPP